MHQKNLAFIHLWENIDVNDKIAHVGLVSLSIMSCTLLISHEPPIFTATASGF